MTQDSWSRMVEEASMHAAAQPEAKTAQYQDSILKLALSWGVSTQCTSSSATSDEILSKHYPCSPVTSHGV